MEGFSSPLTSGNIQYIFAFIIIILAGVVVYLNRRVNQLSDRIDAIQSQRILDAKETMERVTIPLSSISQTINLIYDKIRIGKER